MELTAKEILIKHFLSCDSEYKEEELRAVLNEDSDEGKLVRSALAAMKEAVELAWDASWKRFRQEEYAKEVTAPDKQEFINSLFPESK